MNYQTKATPITTEAEFDAARRVGAHVEFTAGGPGSGCFPEDHYEMPTYDQPDSGGWVRLCHGAPWAPLEPWHLLRAFYPVTSSEEPEA